MNINEFIEKLADQFEDTELSELQSDTEFQQLDDWSSLSTLGIIALLERSMGRRLLLMRLGHAEQSVICMN